METYLPAQAGSGAPAIVVPPQLYKLGEGGTRTWNYLHDQEAREVFSGGSAGPGKTFTGCLFAMWQCLRYPGIRVGIFRDTSKNLQESTVTTMFRVIELSEGQLVEGKHFRWVSNKGLWVWYTGSVTVFDYLAYDPGDPEYRRLGGREFTHAIVDEGDQVEERGVTMLSSRLRYKNTQFCHVCAAKMMAKLSVIEDEDEKGNPILWSCYACGHLTKGLVPKLLVTGNPGDFWTRDRYICDPDGKPVQLPPERKAVTMLLADNPDKAHVATYGKQLEDALKDDPYDHARLIGGDWMAVRKTGKEFLWAFDHVKHVKRVEYEPGNPLHITWDFNSSPYITLLVAQVSRLDDEGIWWLKFLREFCLKHPESNPTAACKALLRAMKPVSKLEPGEKPGPFAGHDAGIFVYGDASGKNQGQNSRDGIFHNYDTVEKELGPHLNSNTWDRVLRKNPAHVVARDFGNSYFKGERKFRVTFHPSMVNTIADMVHTKEGADGRILEVYDKDPATKVRYVKYGHCLQAHYYLTTSMFDEEFATFVRK